MQRTMTSRPGRHRPSGLLIASAALSAGLLLSPAAHAVGEGPYPSHDEGGVSASDILAWASEVVDYSPSPQENTNTNSLNAVGPRNGSTVSLGDLPEDDINAGVAPGEITLRFDVPIFNGPGVDFAVFDNGFAFGEGLFAELAYVEVSTDGASFARFPSISLNEEPLPGGFGSAFSPFDMTYVDNLAGRKASPYGSPFDLDDLLADPLVLEGLLDLNDVRYVRIVDIPGNGSFLDSQGNPIIDNWLTEGTGGFDLDAIGALHAVPEPRAYAALAGLAALGLVLLRRIRTRS